MMFDNFRKKKEAGDQGVPLPARHSRGWKEVLEYMKTCEGLRVLDFGATSAANINYLTNLGHSVYMANVVQEAAKPEWFLPADSTTNKPVFDAKRFAAENFGFSGREFDIILLWDTANYLPPALVPLLFERLCEVLRPDGRLLAFFHGQEKVPAVPFSRYQLTDGDELVVHKSGGFKIQAFHQTRQIEKFLEGYGSVRFFLGKDNVREVMATR